MGVYEVSGVGLEAAYSKDGVFLTDVYNRDGERIGMDTPEPQFLDTAVISTLPNAFSASGTKQGACTDGTYIYVISGDFTNETYYDLLKYRISDGNLTTQRFDGSQVNFGHGNDMAYNPSNGYLYICTMKSDGSVIVVDSTDLSYVGTIYLTNASGNPYAVWQFCFDRLTNHFLSVNGNSILVYDQSWNLITAILIPAHPSATGQGCETDGTFFYRVTYNPNLIDVIRLSDGTRVKTITNPMSGEPETMLYDWSGNYYISRNATSNIVYAVQLFDES